ncbi:multisubunit Na+/H+ antiporter MnhB subunit [Geomicrobium sediminis]|uniref:Multisubunit Na+/H+ antiporter MnhB subunit n=1 Tax=Geomicrobium sediminis TaxID=1347788 RepID=A0ABS2PCI0_9BACL|nr:multisubunit Na+/H+ antiporter MnhB subunit [Geomicrobium sediminis]GAK08270.1 hypothetical protein JCM19038_2047 [Geomicrobium sp. JCM 19038]
MILATLLQIISWCCLLLSVYFFFLLLAYPDVALLPFIAFFMLGLLSRIIVKIIKNAKHRERP